MRRATGYLRYEERPVIFIFPKGEHTNWDKVRAAVNKWEPRPGLFTRTIPAQIRVHSTASMRG